VAAQGRRRIGRRARPRPGRAARRRAAAAICEAELELKSGSAAALFDLAHDLIAEVPFRLDPHAKSDRGFALAARREGQSVRARPATLAPAMSVETAFKLIADGCLRHAALNEECALLGRDPEGVHQMRVALRRLRSAFGLFGDVLPADAGPLNDELRWIAGELGQARDWDVFVSAVLAPLRAQIADDPSLERFAALAEGCRKAGYQRAREAVLSRRYTEAKLWLGGWLVSPWDRHSRSATGPIAPFADALLERRAHKLIKTGRDHAGMSPDELHRLRILAKRMRYAAEFFTGLYRQKTAKKYVQSLARVQDVLGVLNDSSVGVRLLSQAGERAGRAAEEPWFARAGALVKGWYASQTDRELRHLSAAWNALTDQRKFWSKPPADQTATRAA
jgi:CHAD domain-containing protein